MSLLTKYAAARRIQKLASAARAIRKYRSMHKVAERLDYPLTAYDSPREASIYTPSVADLMADDYVQVRDSTGSIPYGGSREEFEDAIDAQYFDSPQDELIHHVDLGPLDNYDARMKRRGRPIYMPPYKAKPGSQILDSEGAWKPKTKNPVNPQLPLR